MKNGKLTLGSLFDGSGGFPLAAVLCGIEPVWASEIEPYPIAVTKSRFPNMKHYGDISKINGAEIEPVDIIAFGSPCQDLSTAGKRAGLKHKENGDEETTRSGLFMEAVRIAKEMRCKTNGTCPTFLIWENVTGAFNSNKGEDFRTVLNELIKIAEPAAVMPPVPKEGYAYADCFCGDGFSLAYRVLDAQYWGVAQRRKRIYLVLDLGGERAKEILFERQGLQGDYREKFKTWERTSGSSEKSVGETGAEDRLGFYETTKKEPIVLESNQVHATVTNTGVCPTLKAAMGEGGGHTPMIVDTKEKYAAGFCPEESAKTRGIGYEEEKSPTLRASHTPAVVKEEPIAFDEYNFSSTGSITETLRTSKAKMPIVFENHGVATPKTLKIRSGKEGGGKGALIQDNKSATLGCNNDQTLFQPKTKEPILYQKETGAICARDYKGIGNQYVSKNKLIVEKQSEYIVRRLTPTECARLQGFPDWWGEIDQKETMSEEEFQFWVDVRNTHAKIVNGSEPKEYSKKQILTWYNRLHNDSSEYKMWGNGVALPCVVYVMQGIAEETEGEICEVEEKKAA